MTKTFTLPKNLQESLVSKGKDPLESEILQLNGSLPLVPSSDCIRNILNFSKNLDVRPSEHLGHLMYLKS
jgi:hypothetical protein